MTAEPARVEKRAATTEPVAEARDDREQAVERIAQLLSTGRPISEILDAIKRLAAQTKATQPNADAEPGELTIVRRPCDGASNLETALAEPIDATEHEVACAADELDRRTNTAFAGPSNSQHPAEAAPVRGTWRTKLFGLLRPVIFWLVPALALILLATAAKMSMDAGVIRKAADALAIAPAGIVPSGENGPLSSAATAAAALVAGSGRVEPQTAADRAEPQTAAGRAEPQTPAPDRAKPRLTPEEVKVLLDRGDALVGVADITSARLFYERAATAGDAQAAVRLGATYDPAFLGQIKFGDVRGDRTIAQHWYQRARELAAKQSEMALHSDAPPSAPTNPENEHGED